MQVTLTQRLYLAAVSGGATFVAFLLTMDTFAVYPLTGALFAVGVLLPWLPAADARSWRPLALIAVSGLSFYAAIYTSNNFGNAKWGPELEQYIAASVVGAAIVLVLAPPVLRLPLSWRVLPIGLVAAVPAGAQFPLLDKAPYGMLISFAIWHSVLAGVLLVSYAQPVNETWFARLAPKWRRSVVAVMSLIVAVPLVDDAVAFLLQSHYQSKDGGIHIIEHVQAHGFLDRRPIHFFGSECARGCLSPVVEGRFSFHEYRVRDGRYEVFFVTSNDDPNCKVYGEDWSAMFKPTYASVARAGGERCMSYRRNDDPLSQYAVRSDFDYRPALFDLYRVKRNVQQLVRIDDDTVVTEKVSYEVDSFIFGTEFSEDEDWELFFDAALPKPESRWSPPPVLPVEPTP